MPRVPLFPLRTVLVPGLVLPLHIFEPRYRLMVRTLTQDGQDTSFGIIAIRPGADPETDGVDALYPVGTVARITSVDALPDGRFDIVTVGTQRFSVLSIDRGLPYLRAEVALHPEPVGDVGRAAALGRCATDLLTRYRSVIASWGVMDVAGIEHLPDDPVVLSYAVSAAIVADLPERQALLDVPDAERRLERACAVLRRELGLMSVVPSMPAVDLASERTRSN